MFFVDDEHSTHPASSVQIRTDASTKAAKAETGSAFSATHKRSTQCYRRGRMELEGDGKTMDNAMLFGEVLEALDG